MFSTAGRLKSASGLYCVKFFISFTHGNSVAFCKQRANQSPTGL